MSQQRSASTPPPTPAEILRSVFGYDRFRPLQLEVIRNVLDRRDTLAVMPTGGGKSLCYQIPALMFPGLTVVVSPLIALMKDQVEQLQALGVPALFLNSSLSYEAYQANLEQVRAGRARLVYMAPETLLTPRIFNLLSGLRLDCLTIDEAHCISEWGHDFRPEYRQLTALRERFPQAVCLALTATATRTVRADIQASLRFQAANEFVASFDRPNLMIEVAPKTDPAAQTLDFLRRFPGASGIIYCFSRKAVDDLSAFLARKGYAVRAYHAGLDDDVRREAQERFIRDDVQIIVATIAFGMGINKPNVRFVIHYDLPKSIEGYYQEIGRAGRDGLPAHCLLLYSYGDVAKLQYFIQQKDPQERQAAARHLDALVAYAESLDCRRRPLLAYFGETYPPGSCDACDNCLNERPAGEDITLYAHKFLSCVKRTGERFAATHVTHVLLGVEDEKVLRYGHQNVSTFGIGQELARKQWLLVGRQMVQQGLLEQSPDQYRSLRLTPKAYEALRTKAVILGQVQGEDAPVRKPAKAGQIEHDADLFERLRQKRKELADQAGVPPYVIFSDRSLVEMAAHYPQSESSLLKINGVGQVKLERYGGIFLEEIRAHCRERGLDEKPRPGETNAAPAKAAPARADRLSRSIEVGRAYNQGEPVQSLAERYGVQTGTIFDHLTRFALAGNPLRSGDDWLAGLDLPGDQIEAALQAFERHGAEYLKPVFEDLGGSLNYDDLKSVRLHFLARRGQA